MTSSADLRRDGDASDADADDRTIQKPPDGVPPAEGAAADGPPIVGDGHGAGAPSPASDDEPDRMLMAKAPKAPKVTAPMPAAALPAVPADKLPPPPSTPLRPRLPSSPSATLTGPAPATVVSPGVTRPSPMVTSTAKPTATANANANAKPNANANATATAKPNAALPPIIGGGSEDEDEIEGPPTLESEPPPSEPATSPKSAAVSGVPLVSSKVPATPKLPSSPVKAADVAATESEPEPTDDSITATAPRVPAPKFPLSPPKSVEIRTIEEHDDSADETEVKTLSADVAALVKNARTEVRAGAAGPAAGAKAPPRPSPASEADAPDDSVTTQAPVAPAPPPGTPMTAASPIASAAATQAAKQGVPARGGSSPVIRISSKSLMSASKEAPSTDRDARPAGAKYDPDEEESVTARGNLGANFPDDSVTTQSPNVGPGAMALPPPIDGETEGTTKRIHEKKKVETHAADEEQDSVTAAAPGHLTNMLRVIASPSDAGSDDYENEDDDDEDVQAHTQVMANAPMKPSDLGIGSRRGGPAAAAARHLEPSSESGLRVANHEAANIGGDRASLGALGVPDGDRRLSSMRQPVASDPGMGPSPSDGLARSPFAPLPMAAEADRKPPYALLVGVVALISVAIPLVLFVVLSQSGGDSAPRVIAQPTPDPVGLTGPRPRAKPAPSAATSGGRRWPPRR